MNLFIALLLSSFGSEKLKDVKDDEINNIQETIYRFKRILSYFFSKVKAKTKTNLAIFINSKQEVHGKINNLVTLYHLKLN